MLAQVLALLGGDLMRIYATADATDAMLGDLVSHFLLDDIVEGGGYDSNNDDDDERGY